MLKQHIQALKPVLKHGGWIAIAASALFCATCTVLMNANAMDQSFLNLQMVEDLSWLLFFSVAAAVGLMLLVLCRMFENQKPIAIVLPAALFFFALLVAHGAPSNILFSLGLMLPIFLGLRWALKKERNPFLSAHNLPMWSTHAVALALFISFTIIMAYYSILRLRVFNATTFDLGIFAQMFEYLRTTGRMLTTVERNRLLTHFAVHVSPIYYLVLPFYMLVPRIETLLVVQAAAVGAGVFAVRGIAEHLFGKSPRLIMLSCLMFIFNPAFSSGLLFDFHENKFLTVLILYAIYFILKQKTWAVLLFGFLILMVKEDAAIYAGALGLWLLIARRWEPSKERKRIIAALSILAASVAWFLIARAIIEHFGGAMMVNRLENYFLPGSVDPGFGDIMQVILSNMGYVIHQVFTPEKFPFMLWLFLPLGFAPFLRKKGADWVLLVPFLVINLLSNYEFQFRIGFQYAFGSFALAIVLALFALRDCSRRTRQRVLALAVMASMLTTVPLVLPRFQHFSRTMYLNEDRIEAVNEVLANLPEDVHITASTFFAVHLYRHRQLYMFPNFFGPQAVTEFLVVRYTEAEHNETLREFIEEHYELVEEAAFVHVYRARRYIETTLVEADESPLVQ